MQKWNVMLSSATRPQSYIPLIVLMALVVLGGCKTKTLPSQYTPQGIRVDGKSIDWTGLRMTHFEDDGFSVGIANDTNRLYLIMRTHDGSIVRTIRMTGMQLWLNAEGKKETGFGVKFRGGPSFGMSMTPRMRDDLPPPGLDRRETQMMNQRRPLFDTALVFTFIDEQQLIDLDIPSDGSLGPAISIDTSEGFYTYEFSIPLQKSEVRYFGLGTSANQEIAVKVIWGEVNRKDMTERLGGMRGGIDGGSPPMGGGMPGGGRGGTGGGPPGGMGKRPDIKKVDLWFKTTLATQ